MLKFLLILALTVYILSKIGTFLFRAGGSSRQFRSQQPGPTDGDIHVDPATRKGRKGTNIKGGDYVDYEEVK